MTPEKILLPYNFSKSDRKALDFVTRTFTPRVESVEITLFHVYTPLPKIDTSKSTVMERLADGMGYARQRIHDLEKDFKQIQTVLVQNGFPRTKVKTVFRAKSKDIASEIIDLASKEGYTMVVLNRKPGRVARFFTGTVFQKVVAGLPDKTVCIVS